MVAVQLRQVCVLKDIKFPHYSAIIASTTEAFSRNNSCANKCLQHTITTRLLVHVRTSPMPTFVYSAVYIEFMQNSSAQNSTNRIPVLVASATNVESTAAPCNSGLTAEFQLLNKLHVCKCALPALLQFIDSIAFQFFSN